MIQFNAAYVQLLHLEFIVLIEWCVWSHPLHHTVYLFCAHTTMWPLLFLFWLRWIELYLCIYGEDGTVHMYNWFSCIVYFRCTSLFRLISHSTMKYNKEWATYYSVTNSMYLLYTTKGLGSEKKSLTNPKRLSIYSIFVTFPLLNSACLWKS